MSPADLHRLTSVTTADVYKAGQRAARLTRTEGAVRFTYRADYLAAQRPAVATTLPLREAPLETTGGAVPPFFAGLLPEGRRLTRLRRSVKTSADDELSLLLAVGSDTVGDVQVIPEGASPDRASPLVAIGRGPSVLRLADVLDAAGVVDPIGLPGVQDKASARRISVPVRRAGERYVLKVDPPEFRHVVENEAFFLRLAREVRMPVAEARILYDADGRSGLLVKRLGRWPADKYNASAEQAVMALAHVCAARVVALRDLYRQLAFAYLTGNGDVHAKNLAILMDASGEWRVAPAYDLPATVPYGDTTLALEIQGRTTDVSRRHWLRFAQAIGLPERAAVRVLDDLLTRLAHLGERLRAGALPFAQRPTADWVAELRHRHRLVRGT